MDTIHLKKYQEKLQGRKKQILATVRRLREESWDVTGQRHFDWLDQASDENEIRLLDRLSQGYARELGKIEMALWRIFSGSYGLCLACHQPIEQRRLGLFPEAEFCLECQEMRERFENAA